MLRHERLSDRPGFAAPAFQFLLAAGGDCYSPLGEDGFDFWDHRAQDPVETPVAQARRAVDPPPSFTRIPQIFTQYSIRSLAKMEQLGCLTRSRKDPYIAGATGNRS